MGDIKRRVEKNRTKFISMYIQAFYGDAYREAEQLYHNIRLNNPNSKDLTKTIDFMRLVTPDKPVPYYYCQKGDSHGETPCNDNKRVMVLNIPLMGKNLTSQIMSTTTTTGHEEEMSAVQTPPEQEEMSVVQTPPEQEEEMSVVQTPPEQEEMSVVQTPPEQEEEMSVVQTPPEQGETRLDIPDRVFVELLEEIKKDPDLHRVFNDINTQDYSEIDDMLDSFIADDITPIEIELAQLGYE